MSMINIEPFEAEFESSDDNGKRHRHPCRVVGVTEDEQLVVLAKGSDGRIGTFRIGHVFRCGK